VRRCFRRSGDRDPAELKMDATLKAKITSAGYRPDPVTTEIVRNGLIAATEEMKTNLMRTAYNMIIYEALDFTVGLFDAEGNTLSIGLGLPMFIRGMSDTVQTKLDHYGVENLDPGAGLLTSAASITGSHLSHMTFRVPIFHDGEVVAFSCLHGALARRRRHARRRHDRHLFRRPADADREDLSQGRAERGT